MPTITVVTLPIATPGFDMAPQTIEERSAGGDFTNRLDLNWKAVNGVTIGTNTTVIFKCGTIKAGDIIISCHLHVTTAWQNTADTAFNSTQLDFGDTGSTTRYLSGVEMNANGSFVVDTYLDPSSSHIYTAADTLEVTLHSMSGKDLTNINAGESYIEFGIIHSADPLKLVPVF